MKLKREFSYIISLLFIFVVFTGCEKDIDYADVPVVLLSPTFGVIDNVWDFDYIDGGYFLDFNVNRQTNPSTEYTNTMDRMIFINYDFRLHWFEAHYSDVEIIYISYYN